MSNFTFFSCTMLKDTQSKQAPFVTKQNEKLSVQILINKFSKPKIPWSPFVKHHIHCINIKKRKFPIITTFRSFKNKYKLKTSTCILFRQICIIHRNRKEIHINNSKKFKIFKAKKSFYFLNNFFIAENGGVFVGSDLKISTLRRR